MKTDSEYVACLDGGYELQFLPSTMAMEPEEWDSLCGSRPFCRHRWLRLLEQVQRDSTPRYALLRRGGRLLGGVACGIRRTFNLEAHLGRATARLVVGALLSRFPILCCGLSLVEQSGLFVCRGQDADAVTNRLMAGLRKMASGDALLFLACCNLDAEEISSGGIRGNTAFQVPALPLTRLAIRWRSMQEYELWLPRKKRSTVRRIRNRALEAGISAMIRDPDSSTLPRLRHLRRQLLRRHGLSEPPWADPYRVAREILGTDFKVLLVSHQGRIVACAGVLSSRGHIMLKWAGMEDSRNPHVYPFLVSESVRYAIDSGSHTLHLGASAYGVKKGVGAVLVPSWLALGSRWPRVDHAMTGVSSAIGPVARVFT